MPSVYNQPDPSSLSRRGTRRRPRIGWYWLIFFPVAIVAYVLVLPLYALCRGVERLWPKRLIEPPELIPGQSGLAQKRSAREIRSFP